MQLKTHLVEPCVSVRSHPACSEQIIQCMEVTWKLAKHEPCISTEGARPLPRSPSCFTTIFLPKPWLFLCVCNWRQHVILCLAMNLKLFFVSFHVYSSQWQWWLIYHMKFGTVGPGMAKRGLFAVVPDCLFFRWNDNCCWQILLAVAS